MSDFFNSIPFTVALIMIGCCSNVIVLELLLNIDPHSGSLITIAQFLFVTFTSMGDQFEKGKFLRLKKTTIPFRFYVLLVGLFFSQSIINNLAFAFNISMPLHTIFRSSSLVMNLLIGMLFFDLKVPISKIFCIIIITMGIMLATYASSLGVREKKESIVFNQEINYTTWCIGISMLTVSQVLSGLLGNLQEYSYRKWGKNWRENIFYSHLLSLPLFLLFSSDLMSSIRKFNQNPVAWIYMILNILTQFMCIRGVYMMTSLAGTLATTMTITVRKFISLIVSVLWFGSYCSWMHWLSMILVFGGSIIFSVIKDEDEQERSDSRKKG